VDFIIGESISFVNFMGKEGGKKGQTKPKRPKKARKKAKKNHRMREGNKNPVCFQYMNLSFYLGENILL